MPNPTARNNLRARLRNAETLTEAVTILKDHYGSDDALAAHLGTSRQRTISWRLKGDFPSAQYRERLAADGVPAHLLKEPVEVEEVWRIQLRLEAELAGLRRLLEGLAPEPS